MGFYEEQIEPTFNKMVAQGASELAHALYAGNAYVAYGATERAAGVAQPEQGAQPPEQSYDAMKAEVAAQAPAIEAPEQGIER